MNPQIIHDLHSIYPELALTATLLLVILVDLAFPRVRHNAAFLVAALGLITALVLSFPLFAATPGTLFYGMIALVSMSVFFKVFLIITSLLVMLAAPGSKELAKEHMGEFFTLLLGVTLGMLFLASATDMLMLFLSLEMVSVGSYIMV